MLKLIRIITFVIVFVCVSTNVEAADVVLNNSTITVAEKSSWSSWGDNLAARIKIFISNDTSINNKDFNYTFYVDKQGNVTFKSVTSSDIKNLKVITPNMKAITKVLNKNAIVKFPQKATKTEVIVNGKYTGKVKKNVEVSNVITVEFPKASVLNQPIVSAATHSSTQSIKPKNTPNQIMIDGELVNVQTVDIGEETVSALVWNQWRADVTNTFLRAWSKNAFGKNKEAQRVRYSFDVDNKGNITNIYITPFDATGNACSEDVKLVILESVKTSLIKIQYSYVLKFPEGSKRTKVTVSDTYVPYNMGRYAKASDYNDTETVKTIK